MEATQLNRKRFIAALALYLAWVGTLGVLAGLSSRKPPQASKVEAPQPSDR